MATIKNFTSLKQSRKLAEILPLESADNVIVTFGCREGTKTIVMPKETLDIIRTPFTDIRNTIPCWSLAALLGVLNSIDGWYPGIDSQINGNMWQICMFSYETGSDISIAAINKELVDTCYEVILKLHERKML